MSPHKPTGRTIEAALEQFLDEKRANDPSPKTIAQYEDVVGRVFVPWAHGAGIRTTDNLDGALTRFTADLKTRKRNGHALSPHTVRTYEKKARAFVKWAGTDLSAYKGPGKPKKLFREALSRSEIDALERACAPSARNALIVRTLADTGIRAGELLGLHASDLHREAGKFWITVRTGKTENSAREVVCPRGTWERLRQWADQQPYDQSVLFVGERRRPKTGELEPLTDSGLQQAIRNAGQRAGLLRKRDHSQGPRRIHAHLLRHSFITNALKGGANPLLVARVVGHSDLKLIHEIYSHISHTDDYDSMMKALKSA